MLSALISPETAGVGILQNWMRKVISEILSINIIYLRKILTADVCEIPDISHWPSPRNLSTAWLVSRVSVHQANDWSAMLRWLWLQD